MKEAKAFLDNNTISDDPFFAYILALGAIQLPHSPLHHCYFMDTRSNVAGEYGPTSQCIMDVFLSLYEIVKVVGALVQVALKDRQLLEDIIIIFTSDNGGLGNATRISDIVYGQLSNGKLYGQKGELYDEGRICV